ncbi:hypothetical protein KAU33_05035 [Candidatus Dependentiae bacterium]|nr:hypothetical protein [Candidatus Dependentiae bacterium]
MKIPENIIDIKQNSEYPQIYDVELCNIPTLKKYSSIDCHLVLYPYSREIDSNNISFNPYEEYVNDLLLSKKSAYRKIIKSFNQVFGIMVGIIIVLVFWRIKPASLISIESIVSVFGAYFVAKEIWNELEELFINITRKLPVKYTTDSYRYKLERHTTLTQYSYFAKKQRYGRETLLPTMIDYVEQSNSQIIKMFLKKSDFDMVNSERAHILSFHLDEKSKEYFQKEGFLFSVKLGFNKAFLGITTSTEIFQSIDKTIPGCLDKKGKWHTNSTFFRKTIRIGRIKWYLTERVENVQVLL